MSRGRRNSLCRLGTTDCAFIEKEVLVSIARIIATQAFDRVIRTSFARASPCILDGVGARVPRAEVTTGILTERRRLAFADHRHNRSPRINAATKNRAPATMEATKRRRVRRRVTDEFRT